MRGTRRSATRLKSSTVRNRSSRISVLQDEPAHIVAVGASIELQRIGIAAPAFHLAIGARHQPGEVPPLAAVAERNGGLDADRRMRPRDEEFAVGVVIARSAVN